MLASLQEEEKFLFFKGIPILGGPRRLGKQIHVLRGNKQEVIESVFCTEIAEQAGGIPYTLNLCTNEVCYLTSYMNIENNFGNFN